MACMNLPCYIVLDCRDNLVHHAEKIDLEKSGNYLFLVKGCVNIYVEFGSFLQVGLISFELCYIFSSN